MSCVSCLSLAHPHPLHALHAAVRTNCHHGASNAATTWACVRALSSQPHQQQHNTSSSSSWGLSTAAAAAAGLFFLAGSTNTASADARRAAKVAAKVNQQQQQQPGKPASTATTAGGGGLPEYTADEVAQHRTPKDRVWVTYKDGVYDITDFIAQVCMNMKDGAATTGCVTLCRPSNKDQALQCKGFCCGTHKQWTE